MEGVKEIGEGQPAGYPSKAEAFTQTQDKLSENKYHYY